MERILAQNPGRANVTLIAGADANFDDLSLNAIRVKTVGQARSATWEQLVLPRLVGREPLLCLGNTAPLSMLVCRRHVAVMIHDLSYRIFPDAYGLAYRTVHATLLPFMLSRGHPIFTVSHSEHMMLASLMRDPKRKVVVTPNGGWRDDVVGEIPFDPTRLDGPMLYVGSMSARKNFVGAMACAVELALRDQRHSIFIGAGGRHLSAMKLDIPEQARPFIELRGQVESHDELEQAYREASCLLFPSFYEASPMPPVEAFALGCPVIASDIPSLRERCGDAALYCQPDDIANMLDCVRRMTTDPDLAASLVYRGYARVRQLSWRDQAEQVLVAMRKSLNGRAPV